MNLRAAVRISTAAVTTYVVSMSTASGISGMEYLYATVLLIIKSILLLYYKYMINLVITF